jgi:para-nitrobenzyl esterase
MTTTNTQQDAADASATTTAGVVRGAVLDGVQRFLGIPYAVAARFQHPQPAPAWEGERDATAYGPIPPQVPMIIEQMLGSADIEQDEDACLSLNVFAPAAATPGSAHPVMVWIHGGAFVTGSGRTAWYEGDNLVRRGDVVVVTINYRLGALGFAEGVSEGSGNLGVLDQVAALRWVHDNIASFGGDPANVTIFGESAGGCSVVTLLACPASVGLVHRAIAQSPSIGQLREAARGADATDELLVALGLPAGATDQLLTIGTDQLTKTAGGLFNEMPKGVTAASPTADGTVLAASVDGILAAMAASPVPLVIGTNRDEMALFSAMDPTYASLDDAGLHKLAVAILGPDADALVDAYRAARPEASARDLAIAISTDHTFRAPATRLAQARAEAGHATWLYEFTWATPAFGGMLGSCHALEIPFVFDNLDKPGVGMFTGDGAERQGIATDMAERWLSFARTGSPTADETQPSWPAYDTQTRPVLRIDVVREVVLDPDASLRELW